MILAEKTFSVIAMELAAAAIHAKTKNYFPDCFAALAMTMIFTYHINCEMIQAK